MGVIKVKKRDNTTERWSADKIITSICKSGINIEDAERISSAVEKWCVIKSGDGVITSENIKNKVIEEIKNIDPVASETYRLFKK